MGRSGSRSVPAIKPPAHSFLNHPSPLLLLVGRHPSGGFPPTLAWEL